MKDKIIIMPNGDGELASRITCVGHVLRGSGGGPKPVEWGPKVKIGGVGTYDVQDNVTAIAERDRILSEWQAWLEGPAELPLRERVGEGHEPGDRALSTIQITTTAHRLAAKLCVAGTDENREVVSGMVMDELDGLRFDEGYMALCGRPDNEPPIK